MKRALVAAVSLTLIASPARAATYGQLSFTGHDVELGTTLLTLDPVSGDPVVIASSGPRECSSLGAHAYSPDGTRIAYVKNSCGTDFGALRASVIVMDPDGANKTKVFRGASPLGSTVMLGPQPWSPGGGRLTFVHNRNIHGERSADLVVARSDDEGARVIAGGEGAPFPFAPAWRPDGDRIMFPFGKGDDERLRDVRPEGTGNRSLTWMRAGSLAGDPLYSPNGKAILFERQEPSVNFKPADLWRVRKDGNRKQRLTSDALHEQEARWSVLEGKNHITFARGTHIVRMGGFGRGEVALTPECCYRLPRPSPDGTKVAYVGGPYSEYPWSLWVDDVATGSATDRYDMTEDEGYDLEWQPLP